jgi:hypothetical protein
MNLSKSYENRWIHINAYDFIPSNASCGIVLRFSYQCIWFHTLQCQLRHCSKIFLAYPSSIILKKKKIRFNFSPFISCRPFVTGLWTVMNFHERLTSVTKSFSFINLSWKEPLQEFLTFRKIFKRKTKNVKFLFYIL